MDNNRREEVILIADGGQISELLSLIAGVLAAFLAFIGEYLLIPALLSGILAMYLAYVARKRGSRDMIMKMGMVWGILISVVIIVMMFMRLFIE